MFVRFLNKPLSSDYKVRFDDPVRLHRVLIRLSGFLFFGTIASVEDTIRSVINGPSWQHNPVRFLVLDLSLVAGIDMSSAEAFVRVQRLLATKYVTLVFCGFPAESAICQALRCVGVIGGERVELFSTFDEAMECELATFRRKR
jgi:SulP family sulfate permease